MKRLSFEELREFDLEKLEKLQKEAFIKQEELTEYLQELDYLILN